MKQTIKTFINKIEEYIGATIETLLCSALIFIVPEVAAQPFQKKFPGGAFYSIERLPSGNFMLAGLTNAGDELLVGQYTPAGNVVYNKGIRPTGGMGIDDTHVRNMLTLDGDSVVVPIYLSMGVSGRYIGALTKLETATGNVGWWKRYLNGTLASGGNPRGGITAAFKTQSSSHYISTGWSNPGLSTDAFNYGGYIAKTDLQGNPVWAYQLRTGFEFLFAACEAANGHYIFAGGTVYVRVMSTDPDGAFQWSYRYLIDGKSGEATDIIRTADNGYMVVGTSNNDGYLMKLNASGIIQWVKAIGGASADNLYSVRQTSDGGYIGCGRTSSYGYGGQDGWLLKVNGSGNYVWSKVYGAVSDESLNDVVESGGYFYAAGTIGSDGWIVAADAATGSAECGEMDFIPFIIDRTSTSSQTSVSYVASPYSEEIPEPVTVVTPSITPDNVCVPLPVDLLSFRGIRTPEKNSLFWETLSERNNHYFRIERSRDALHWELAGYQEGMGNSNETQRYTFLEEASPEDVSATLYYRLVQTDHDGTSKVSEILRLLPAEEEDLFMIYPQPVKDHLIISSHSEVPYTVVILSAEGKEILRREISSSREEIETHHWQAGFYLLKILVHGEPKAIRKIIRQ